ncbi:hypothetical protein HPO96_29295 [Kribbella sandramycini]|uniref:Uncharacterized protein n=1 Tax=Kribbella sandramycini TaxID=60450 RepID=A0A7Y4L6R5_9ACTN|nr:hypothetical protein [Kribbella sandramycini]MBB6571706.1 hypothetical protein [Kribbella sandramycini]NOL44351.1 hypothetical protein [Kribbella sandramycini]
MTLIPNGTLITTREALDELIDSVNPPVVVDREGHPWIVFANEDGDDWAVTAECPDDEIPAATGFDGLLDRGPLRVVYNGRNRDDQWTSQTGVEVSA